MNSVVTFGSINMDLVARTPRFAEPGETLVGSDFFTAAGGKGANQAVAVGKLGVPSIMVGRVGDDIFASDLMESMQNNGVDISAVKIDHSAPTGTAIITVDDQAENQIIIIPGANGNFDDEDLGRAYSILSEAEILLLQLEIPLEIVENAAKMAKKLGVKVMLDPAPAQELSDELLQAIDIITPNETETYLLTGQRVNSVEKARMAAEKVMKRGVKAVVIKMSSKGSFYMDAVQEIHFPAFKVQAVDTVAAGDAFNGGFAAALALGKNIQQAMQWGNACGALSTTKNGAQPSMPTRTELEAFIKVSA